MKLAPDRIKVALELLDEVEDEFQDARAEYLSGQSPFSINIEADMAVWAEKQISTISKTRQILQEYL